MSLRLTAFEVAELRRIRRPSDGILWRRLAFAAAGLIAVLCLVGWLS